MTRTRDRVSAEGLLPRMEARRWKDGKTITYRYHPLEGKPIKLGCNREQAIRQVLDLNGTDESTGTVKWVWEKYQHSPRWKKLAQTTRDDYMQCSVELLHVFGSTPIASITAPMVSRYIRIHREGAPVRANHEKALLSNLFTMGIDLGVCEHNPCKEVRPNEEESRTVAVDPKLLAKYVDWLMGQTPQRRVLALAAEYAAVAGSRQVEFLPLEWAQVHRGEGEVRIARRKQRGKRVGMVVEHMAISERLGELLDRLGALHQARGMGCAYVFPTEDNNAYSARGFKTLWQRCMRLQSRRRC